MAASKWTRNPNPNPNPNPTQELLAESAADKNPFEGYAVEVSSK